MAKKFRKKPVVIDAFQWTIDEVPEWWTNLKGTTMDIATMSAFIPTLEGTMEAKKGDYIIRGVKGEVYPCKPDIFEMTYEHEPETSESAPKQQQGNVWIYEDKLPPMSDEDYSKWYAKSKVIDGVRMGPNPSAEDKDVKVEAVELYVKTDKVTNYIMTCFEPNGNMEDAYLEPLQPNQLWPDHVRSMVAKYLANPKQQTLNK